jgi:hypothetical protein
VEDHDHEQDEELEQEMDASVKESDIPGFPSFSPMQVGLLNAHELYRGLRDAGFNPAQAIYLVACIITGGPRPPRGAEEAE